MEFLVYNFLKLLVILFFINFVALRGVLNDTNRFSLAYVYPKLYHGVSGHSQHGQSIIEAIVFVINDLISLTGYHYLDLNYNYIIQKGQPILSSLTQTIIGTSSSYKVFVSFLS